MTRKDYVDYESIGKRDIINTHHIDNQSDNESDNVSDKDKDSVSSEIFNLTDESPLREKIKIIVECSVPTISTLLMSVISMTITMYFAGILSQRSGDDSIFAGVSLASTFANLTFSSVMEGFSSAIESLSSQHNGAKNYSAVGITLHQSIVSLFSISVPILVSWYYVGSIFLFLGVDPAICLVTQNYLSIKILATPGEILILTYEKYLQSMGLMSPSMHAASIYNIFLFLFSYVLITLYQYSYFSIAWIHIICTYLQFFFLVLISVSSKEVSRTLMIPTLEIFHRIFLFLSYGLSGCVMMCAEWWAYELLTVFASLLSSSTSASSSSIAISAQSILLQFIVILFMFPLGIGISIASIIGNAIGSEQYLLAKSIGNLSFLLIFLLDLCLCPLVYNYGVEYVYLFTSNEEIIAICRQCLPLLSIQIFIDGLQAIGSGILRGAGRQSLGAWINLCAYYGVALPMAWYLCFQQNLGVFGLFVGVFIGSCLQTIAILGCVYYYSNYIYSEIEIVKMIHDQPFERDTEMNRLLVN